MQATTRFAALLIILSLPVDPVGAQARLEPLPTTSRLALPPALADRPTGGVEELDFDLRFNAPTEPGESAGTGTVILSTMATGIFFGAMLGGIYGDSQEGCTECDFWGAVSGGFLGGLVGLAAGLAISIRN